MLITPNQNHSTNSNIGNAHHLIMWDENNLLQQ